MDDAATRDLRQYVLALVWSLFNDDSAEGVLDRVPVAPSMVTGLTPRPHRWDSNRINGFDLNGSFSTSKVMAMDFSGGKFEDRYDIVTAYVTPDNLPEHLGARVSAHGQPGITVDSICVEAETLKNPPTPPEAPASPSVPLPVSVSVPDAAPIAEAPQPVMSAAAEQQPLQPAIGGIEVVPSFELAGLIDDVSYRQIQVMRDFENFAKISVYMAADPTTMHFGQPPSWEPVIRLGTGGMTIGFMVDAPELGFVDQRACLFEFSSDGITLSDARVNARGVIWRSVTERRNAIEESGDATAMEAWAGSANEFSELMGWTRFAPTGVDGFSWGGKRRKPERSPKNTKWRTDAGGNGVLATVSSWGGEPVRKPRSIDMAIHKASEQASTGAPAHALHLLREALVIANRTHSATSAVEIYRAMVDPLERLGRTTAAARSEALAAVGTA